MKSLNYSTSRLDGKSLPVWVEWIEVSFDKNLVRSFFTSLPVWVEWIEVLYLYDFSPDLLVFTRLGRVD